MTYLPPGTLSELSELGIKDVRAQKFPGTDFFKTLTVGRKWQDYIKNVKKWGVTELVLKIRRITDHSISRISSHPRRFWLDSLLSAYI